MCDYRQIIERMGGDTYAKDSISEDECIKQLLSLSEREFLSGAYWGIKSLLGSKANNLLNCLSLCEDRNSFLNQLAVFKEGKDFGNNFNRG